MKHHSLLIIGTVLLAACAPISPTQTDNGSTGLTTGGGMMQGGQGMMGGNRGGMTQGSFLPARGKDIARLPAAKPMSIMEVQDGDTIALNPELVRAKINGKDIAMYAYNGQFPGPTLKVKQGSTFTVKVTNNIDVPTTIHWHGIRLENKFDGAAGVTQEAIEPGRSFTYTVKVPDEGMFWYHPHVREDLQQDMGLYGLLHVTAKNAEAYREVDEERYVVLDDMLLEGGLPVPFGRDEADHALMGRFGNVMLVNGAEPAPIEAGLGTVVRFTFLNASNTRTYRIVKPRGGMLKIVGGDAGRNAKEFLADAYVLSPSERVIAEMYFWDDGVNRGDQSRTAAPIVVAGSPSDARTVLSATIIGGIVGDDRSEEFRLLRAHRDRADDIDAFRSFFDKPVDKTIHLSVESSMARMMGGGMGHGMDHGGTQGDGVEWEDPMPHMNAMSTKGNTRWKLIDEASAAANMDIAYRFKVGDKVKIRLVNDKEADGSDHPMQHPIHFHGQRFLVLAVNGERNENLVWKDTVLVPKDATVDILLDVSNPGDWMMHCHIAEHLSNGMMATFTVE